MKPSKHYKFLFAVAMFGGNATFFRNLQEAVSKHTDVEATWLPIECELPEVIAKIPPFSLNWTLSGALVTKRRIMALERAGKEFDAALFHHQVLTVMLGGFSRRVPYIISTDATPGQHDRYGYWYAKKPIPFERLLHSLKMFLTQRLYARARYVLPFSEWTRNAIINEYRIDQDKVVALPPGVNLAHWTCPRTKTAGTGRLNVLFVGGEFLRKGGDILTDLAVKEEFSGCDFHFVTQSYTGPTAANIFVHRDLTANSRMLRTLYADADIFMLPTRADFSPWAIVEAMSQRIPVITTDTGGIREMVEDGRTGFLTAVDDREAMERHLRTLMQNPALRICLGDAGRRRVEERYDQDMNVGKLIDYMKSISAQS